MTVSPEVVRVAALLCGTTIILAGAAVTALAHMAVEGVALVGVGTSAITWVIRAPGDVRFTKAERESMRPGQ